MLSDSESDCSPVKLPLPAAEEIERKVSLLQATYPQLDPMVIQDTLKYGLSSHNNNLYIK